MNGVRKLREIIPQPFSACHEGEGTLLCRSLLDGLNSQKFPFMHADEMPAGVSIGNHTHTDNEEIYYLVSGKGVLTYDGQEFEMGAGDVSLCAMGHTHGFLAVENCILIVVGSFA